MNKKSINEMTVDEFGALSEREKRVEYVTFYRLFLYNRGLPCGPKAIREKMEEEDIRPLPSTSTITRILREQCLTHGRTGYYEADYISAGEI